MAKSKSGRVLKITRQPLKSKEKDPVGSGLDAVLSVANGGRSSIAMTRAQAEKALRLVMEGAPVAWTHGAKSMSSRAAFVLVIREKDDIHVVGADVKRADGNKGPAAAFPALAPWSDSAAPAKDIPGETAEKREAARAAGRGVELHALSDVTDPALKARLLALPNKATVKARFTLKEVASHFGVEI